jgi:hypothetical protein
MQKTWTYNKIRQVLQAASINAASQDELADQLRSEYDAFIYYRRDADGQVREHPCSTDAVKDKIRLCVELGLLESQQDCSPTDLGRDALDPDRYDFVLQQAVLDYLESQGISFERIQEAIEESLVPTWRSLHQYLATPLSEDRFRTSLFLLSLCGEDNGQNILKGSVVKVYVT